MLYDNALNRGRYYVKMQYSVDHTNNHTSSNKKGQRNVIWFNPPYSKNVRTNVARIFLGLIDKHFPKSSKLNKIFNRNSVKVSYSCMGNIKSVISSHNHQLLESRSAATELTQKDNCSCKIKSECPLQGSCLTKNIVYKAEITSTNEEDAKEYIGMTATTFKERYRNHKTSINNERYATETELSKYVWKLKASGKPVNIKWSILKRASPRSAGGQRCDLCLTEKLCIIRADKNKTLNKRTELFSKCCHRNKFNAGRFKRVQQTNTGKIKSVRQNKRVQRKNTRQQTVEKLAQANNELNQNSVA